VGTFKCRNKFAISSFAPEINKGTFRILLITTKTCFITTISSLTCGNDAYALTKNVSIDTYKKYASQGRKWKKRNWIGLPILVASIVTILD
jgi:hypothetical protein